MLYGIDRLPRDVNSYVKIFIYKDKYLTDKQFIKASKEDWTNVKSNATKYKILNDVDRWDELEHLNVEPQIAALVVEPYYITTSGDIYYGTTKKKKLQKMYELTINGITKRYWTSDLLYHAFLDKSYAIDEKRTYISDSWRENNITLDNINLKNNDLPKEGAKSENSTSPQEQPDFLKAIEGFI